jgi:hypothetical protein
MTQVHIKEAFDSPSLLQSCLGFLRQLASEKAARAACAVVPLQLVAYPTASAPLCLRPSSLLHTSCKEEVLSAACCNPGVEEARVAIEQQARHIDSAGTSTPAASLVFALCYKGHFSGCTN